MPQLYRQQIKLRLANTASSNMVVPQQQPQQQQSQPQPQHSMHDYNVQINMTPKQQQQLQQQLQQQQVQLQPVQQQQQQHLQQPLVSVNTKNALVSQQTSSRVQVLLFCLLLLIFGLKRFFLKKFTIDTVFFICITPNNVKFKDFIQLKNQIILEIDKTSESISHNYAE